MPQSSREKASQKLADALLDYLDCMVLPEIRSHAQPLRRDAAVKKLLKQSFQAKDKKTKDESDNVFGC